MSTRKDHTYLRRLPPEAYRGLGVAVHWTMTIQDRCTGWLNEPSHPRFREILTHTAFRYGLAAPIYCLMPDHLHLVTIGSREDSDQRQGTRFLRRQFNDLALKPAGFELQTQPFDHVLRDSERDPDALSDLGSYIRANPIRAGLVASEDALPGYRFTGCLVPGYPELNIWAEDYWSRFWRTFEYLSK